MVLLYHIYEKCVRKNHQLKPTAHEKSIRKNLK